MNLQRGLVSVSCCAFLIIGFTGCDWLWSGNPWIGKWKLETINDRNRETYPWHLHKDDTGTSDGIEHYDYYYDWWFDLEGTWFADMTFIGDPEWVSLTARGSYSLSGSNYTPLTRTLLEFRFFEGRVVLVDETTGFPASENISSFADIATGTWSENGDSLTLRSDAGHVLTFRRRDD